MTAGSLPGRLPTAINGAGAAAPPNPNQPTTADETEVRRVALIVSEILKQLGMTPAGGAAQSSDGGRTLPAFMSMREIAVRIGNISETTLWRWHSSGRLGPVGDRRG